jgi:hypothetical protein
MGFGLLRYRVYGKIGDGEILNQTMSFGKPIIPSFHYSMLGAKAHSRNILCEFRIEIIKRKLDNHVTL